MAGIPALNQLNQLNVLNQVDVFLWLTAPLDSFSHWSGYPGSSQKNATLGGFAVVQNPMAPAMAQALAMAQAKAKAIAALHGNQL